MKQQARVRQILPADGWGAALVGLSLEDPPDLYRVPLVCWALHERKHPDQDDSVIGYTVAPESNLVIPCHEVYAETEDSCPTKFVGYVPPGASEQMHHEWAMRCYRDWREREEQDLALLEAGWAIRDDGSGVHYISPDGREMRRTQALKEAVSVGAVPVDEERF